MNATTTRRRFWDAVSLAIGSLFLIPISVAANNLEPPKDVWVYHQSTGEISLNGKVIGQGYSGNNRGLNNPELENQKNIGPIPRGEWSIGESFKHETKGPIVMRLTPVGHGAHGRSGFLIHGDNGRGDNSASEGCIILGPSIRNMIAESGIKKLLVEK